MEREDIGLWLTIAAVAAAIWFGLWGRHMPVRYAMQYSADLANVTVEDKPHDCEFLTAPLGSKNCDYEKSVAVERYNQDTETGRPIVAYGNSKKWEWNDGGPLSGASVYVRWTKVED